MGIILPFYCSSSGSSCFSPSSSSPSPSFSPLPHVSLFLRDLTDPILSWSIRP